MSRGAETLDGVTVGEELAGRLRREILRGKRKPSDPLPEEPLATRYDMSRPSVRDSLGMLAREGLGNG